MPADRHVAQSVEQPMSASRPVLASGNPRCRAGGVDDGRGAKSRGWRRRRAGRSRTGSPCHGRRPAGRGGSGRLALTRLRLSGQDRRERRQAVSRCRQLLLRGSRRLGRWRERPDRALPAATGPERWRFRATAAGPAWSSTGCRACRRPAPIARHGPRRASRPWSPRPSPTSIRRFNGARSTGRRARRRPRARSTRNPTTTPCSRR